MTNLLFLLILILLIFTCLFHSSKCSNYPHHSFYYDVPIPVPVTAIAQLKTQSGESVGNVVFFQPRPPDGSVFIAGNLTGLPKGNHGFHIHRDGDLRQGCNSMGPHYNPLLTPHGSPLDPTRHVGDLGNIVVNDDGMAIIQLQDEIISLGGPLNIVGRGLIVHEKEDDLGRGGTPESMKTGNSGERIACGAIVYASSD